MDLTSHDYSFEELCIPLRDELVNYGQRLSGGRGCQEEDLAQQTLLKAWLAWSRWSPQDAEPALAARAWLYKILHNLYNSIYQQQRNRRKIEESRLAEVMQGLHGDVDEVENGLPFEDNNLHGRKLNKGGSTKNVHQILTERVFTRTPQPDHALQLEPNDHVQEAIAKLRPRWRAVLQLYYFKQYSIEQVADELGMPQGTVSGCLARARKKLGPLLETYAKDRYGIKPTPADETSSVGVDATMETTEVMEPDPDRVDCVVRDDNPLPFLVGEVAPHQPTAW